MIMMKMRTLDAMHFDSKGVAGTRPCDEQYEGKYIECERTSSEAHH